ncbi:hypothetical protein Nepgr_001651 [Nepenthes gracilis]|uniref:Uncharacterized protein n=1 Tax=Nepenthes gracilis TaxID=150966 RepID=A0AAD3P8T7_NEPGR|nr:hypothetical protein Nepgr_001651 [Nepenthes gracilis]
MEGSSETFLEILLAIILPPLGVFLKYRCMAEFWISVLLALSGWIPVIIYAVYGCGVLDQRLADSLGLDPWNYICRLGHHQVNRRSNMEPLVGGQTWSRSRSNMEPLVGGQTWSRFQEVAYRRSNMDMLEGGRTWSHI